MANRMRNSIEIEGFVTSKIWEWDDDILFRLCNFPDGVPNPDSDARAHPVYTTVRVPGGILNGVPIGVRAQQHVHITGQLRSRDYRHSLADFLSRARVRGERETGAQDAPEVDLPFDPRGLVENRSLNEIWARSLHIVFNANGNGPEHQGRRRQRGKRKSRGAAGSPPVDKIESLSPPETLPVDVSPARAESEAPQRGKRRSRGAAGSPPAGDGDNLAPPETLFVDILPAQAEGEVQAEA